MWLQSIPESHRPLLVREVVCTPMVVHHPGVKQLRLHDLLKPDVRIPLRAEHRRGNPTDLYQRSVESGPGHSALRRANIYPTSDRQPILVRTGKLIKFGSHYRQRHIHSHFSRGHGQRKCELNAFLIAPLRKGSTGAAFAGIRIERYALLIDQVLDHDVIDLCHHAHTTYEPVASRRGRFYAHSGHQWTGILDGYDWSPAPSEMLKIGPVQIQKAIGRALGCIDQVRVVALLHQRYQISGFGIQGRAQVMIDERLAADGYRMCRRRRLL